MQCTCEAGNIYVYDLYNQYSIIRCNKMIYGPETPIKVNNVAALIGATLELNKRNYMI